MHNYMKVYCVSPGMTDYRISSRVVNVLPDLELNRTRCIQYEILMDSVIENTENFSIIFTSRDSSVVFLSNSIIVIILDSNSEPYQNLGI